MWGSGPSAVVNTGHDDAYLQRLAIAVHLIFSTVQYCIATVCLGIQDLRPDKYPTDGHRHFNDNNRGTAG